MAGKIDTSRRINRVWEMESKPTTYFVEIKNNKDELEYLRLVVGPEETRMHHLNQDYFEATMKTLGAKIFENKDQHLNRVLYRLCLFWYELESFKKSLDENTSTETTKLVSETCDAN